MLTSSLKAVKEEREKVQREAKRYDDDDGHIKISGLRQLLLAAVIMSAKALPPQTKNEQTEKHLSKHKSEKFNPDIHESI